jgi:hypothetical protein
MKTSPMRVLPLFALLLLAFGAGACSSYSYYDLDLTFGNGFNFNNISTIADCHLLVSGAATDSIQLDPGQCRISTAGEYGKVEYSTFADSGSITFTLNAFQKPANNPNCELGEGSITLEAGTAVRRSGTVTAVTTTPASPCPTM